MKHILPRHQVLRVWVQNFCNNELVIYLLHLNDYIQGSQKYASIDTCKLFVWLPEYYYALNLE